MNYLKEITKDLLDYLIEGLMDGTEVDQFMNGTFPSTYILGKSYKFYRKFEDTIGITDATVIPVLVVTIPDKYKEGKLLTRGTFIDLKTLLLNENPSNPHPVNFFVVPQITGLNGNHLGTMNYVVDVDYNSDFDFYGYIGDEISQIIKMLYYRKRSGDFYNLALSDARKIFFVPEGIDEIKNGGAILGRIKHRFNLRGCNFA